MQMEAFDGADLYGGWPQPLGAFQMLPAFQLLPVDVMVVVMNLVNGVVASIVMNGSEAKDRAPIRIDLTPEKGPLVDALVAGIEELCTWAGALDKEGHGALTQKRDGGPLKPGTTFAEAFTASAEGPANPCFLLLNRFVQEVKKAKLLAARGSDIHQLAAQTMRAVVAACMAAFAHHGNENDVQAFSEVLSFLRQSPAPKISVPDMAFVALTPAVGPNLEEVLMGAPSYDLRSVPAVTGTEGEKGPIQLR